MVQYRLTYFDLRGRGECIRVLFHAAGQKFEDNRVTFEQWPALKPKSPFGHLPYLEVDGKPLAETPAILRYLGRKLGFVPKDDFEEAQLEALFSTQRDFEFECKEFFAVISGFKQGDKEKLYAEVFKPAVERLFPILIAQLKKSGSGFLSKDGPTWFDFYLAENTYQMRSKASELLKQYPEIDAHLTKVHSLPKVAPYVSQRKDSAV